MNKLLDDTQTARQTRNQVRLFLLSHFSPQWESLNRGSYTEPLFHNIRPHSFSYVLSPCLRYLNQGVTFAALCAVSFNLESTRFSCEYLNQFRNSRILILPNLPACNQRLCQGRCRRHSKQPPRSFRLRVQIIKRSGCQFSILFSIFLEVTTHPKVRDCDSIKLEPIPRTLPETRESESLYGKSVSQRYMINKIYMIDCATVTCCLIIATIGQPSIRREPLPTMMSAALSQVHQWPTSSPAWDGNNAHAFYVPFAISL